jgi:hypothetical protein
MVAYSKTAVTALRQWKVAFLYRIYAGDTNMAHWFVEQAYLVRGRSSCARTCPRWWRCASGGALRRRATTGRAAACRAYGRGC